MSGPSVRRPSSASTRTNVHREKSNPRKTRYFEDALAMNARMDARTWLAHTQEQYATMLFARADSADRDKAAALQDAALTQARESGMRTLEERITAGGD